jgi:transcriptional regulator with XRE-family HTH domain
MSKFQRLCRDKGFPSDYALSQTAKITRDYISKLVNGHIASPSRTTLEKIARAFAEKTGNPMEKELSELEKFFMSSPNSNRRGESNTCRQNGEDLGVPLNSNFYVERPPIESNCYKVIEQSESLIRIKAPRQMGKTSLMSKVLNHAANKGYRKVSLNLRLAESTDYTNLDHFLRWFCTSVTIMQGLPNMIDEHWDKKLGNSKLKCTSYFQEHLLAVDKPLALGLDEVDRVFPYPAIAGDFLGMLRTWHESAKTSDIWKRLRLVVVHREVYTQLSIDQSPFNVGTPIELLEFTPEQVGNLVQMNGLDWDTPLVQQLMDVVGGHPHLVQQVVSYLRSFKDTTLEQLLVTASTDTGIFGDHLKQLLWGLQQQPELITALKQVVTATSPVRLKSLEQVSKLLSMGLVQLQGNQVVTPSCKLYHQYFCAQI